MKRIQGWSRLNWLGGILIIVSWHIHFTKLLMPLMPVCCFANEVQGLQKKLFIKGQLFYSLIPINKSITSVSFRFYHYKPLSTWSYKPIKVCEVI